MSSTESSGFDVMKKMDQIEEANVGIAIATASIDDEEMVHFLPQKSAKIKRAGYEYREFQGDCKKSSLIL